MIYLQDSDFTLHLGDVLEVLREMPSESVDCVITSPPYWGLRDYGTGAWAGGDLDCDHGAARIERRQAGRQTDLDGGTPGSLRDKPLTVCPCGATRTDNQLGLEPTPEQYVGRMTEVFREVRRVLAAHGTCWLNMGDSYASQGGPQVPQTKQHQGSGLHGANRAPISAKVKDLVGVPWRLAFALQADGWYLRSDIVWSKPNPMPESVTDRPTKAHEYVFLLTKQARYFFDQEAVREPHSESTFRMNPRYGSRDDVRITRENAEQVNSRGYQTPQNPGGWNERWLNPAGRNIRSVWEIATQPYPEAHFATFPEELVRRCLLAGCPEQVCGECGKPRERILEANGVQFTGRRHGLGGDNRIDIGIRASFLGKQENVPVRTTAGFTDCGHDAYHPGIVLDPFMGSGTTALVARKHARRAVGIELNAEYCELIVKRTQQLSLLSELGDYVAPA